MGVRTASRMTASGMASERTLAPVDEFAVFVLFGFLVALGVFLALGRWYPGSGAEQVDWRPTRSPEVEAELELDDVDQMLEAQNARRRAAGRWRGSCARPARRCAARPAVPSAWPRSRPPARRRWWPTRTGSARSWPSWMGGGWCAGRWEAPKARPRTGTAHA